MNTPAFGKMGHHNRFPTSSFSVFEKVLHAFQSHLKKGTDNIGGEKISNRFTDNSNSTVLKFLRFSENTRLKSAVEILSAQLLQPITISSMGDGRNSNFTKSPIRNKPFIPHIIFVG